MEIVVKQINSKNAEKLKCKVDPKDKVSVLRRLVADNIGADESSIKLIFKGRFLKDETDLEIHGALDLWSLFRLSREQRSVVIRKFRSWNNPSHP